MLVLYLFCCWVYFIIKSYIFDNMKRPLKKLSISLDPQVNYILEEGGFNKSKVINQLLKKYLEKNKYKFKI